MYREKGRVFSCEPNADLNRLRGTTPNITQKALVVLSESQNKRNPQDVRKRFDVGGNRQMWWRVAGRVPVCTANLQEIVKNKFNGFKVVK